MTNILRSYFPTFANSFVLLPCLPRAGERRAQDNKGSHRAVSHLYQNPKENIYYRWNVIPSVFTFLRRSHTVAINSSLFGWERSFSIKKFEPQHHGYCYRLSFSTFRQWRKKKEWHSVVSLLTHLLKTSEKDQSAKQIIIFSPSIPIIFNKKHWFSDFPALLNCF